MIRIALSAAVRAAILAFGLVAVSAPAEPFPPTGPEFVVLDDSDLVPWGHHKAELTPITLEQANIFLAAVRAEKMESRYIVGSCEDRAHFIALIAKKAGIPVAKVWAIAPKRYTLLSRELFTVKDPSGVVNEVSWGHHVAPIFLVDQGGGDVRTMVVDFAFAPDAYLPLTEWTRKLGTPRGKFFFTSANNYLFTSLDAVNGQGRWISGPDGCKKAGNCQNHALPTWFPNILSGDMSDYQPSVNNPWIASGLAQDELAMRTFDTLATFPAGERDVLKEAIKSEKGVKRLAGIETPAIEGLSAATLRKSSGFYTERVAHWTRRLAALQ